MKRAQKFETWVLTSLIGTGTVLISGYSSADEEEPVPGNVEEALINVEWTGRVFLEESSGTDEHVVVPYGSHDGIACLASPVWHRLSGIGNGNGIF